MSNSVTMFGKTTPEHLQRDFSDCRQSPPRARSVTDIKLLERKRVGRMLIYTYIIRAGRENVLIEGILSRIKHGIK